MEKVLNIITKQSMLMYVCMYVCTGYSPKNTKTKEGNGLSYCSLLMPLEMEAVVSY